MSIAMLDAIAEKFRFIANTRYSRKSPLYSRLASSVADDPDVLDLLSGTDVNKQLPNLLMGAVHFLLLKGTDHPLKAYYATLTDVPRDPDDVYPVFRDFCLQHTVAIRQIVETHWVQVNEVQRCAVLLPALAEVARRTKDEPLAVFEIGASAGLLLLWDYYHYDYGNITLGSDKAPISLKCELRGDQKPPLKENTFPSIIARLGMDIAPIDLHDPDEVLWLRALVWPGQTKRAERLQRAIALAQENPPNVLKGDARTEVIRLAEHLPDDTPLCIFYSALLRVARIAAHEQIVELARRRPVYVIGFSGDMITLYDYVNDGGTPTQIAKGFGIGEWIEWLIPSN